MLRERVSLVAILRAMYLPINLIHQNVQALPFYTPSRELIVSLPVYNRLSSLAGTFQ